MYIFIETRLFSQLRNDCLSDEEYRQVQIELIGNPETGAVIRGSGGTRKLRWRAPGRGKRGGYRLIYLVRHQHEEIWMLTIYPKNVRDSISAHILNQIRLEIESEQ